VSAGVLQFHERAPVIAGAQSVAGKLLVWVVGCALLGWHDVPLPMLAAFSLVLWFPQHRRWLLSLAALGLIAARFLPRDLRSLDGFFTALSGIGAGRWVTYLGSTAIAGGTVVLLVWAAIHFDRLPAVVRRRPLLWLHVIAAMALVAGARTGITVLLLAPFLVWRASYLLKSAAAGRAAGTRFRDHLFYLIPVFGGTNTPYGKGLEYLSRMEARTPEAAALSQLAGLRLLALAVILEVLLELMFAVVHGSRDTMFGDSLARWSIGLPVLADFLGNRAYAGTPERWLAVYLELIRATTRLAVFGHVIVGSLRLLGFNVFRTHTSRCSRRRSWSSGTASTITSRNCSSSCSSIPPSTGAPGQARASGCSWPCLPRPSRAMRIFT
jgi:hypothetical protein